MLNKWLGPRKSEEQKRVESVVWHNPPVGPHRLGDMDEDQLRAELAHIHQHLKDGGRIQLNPDDAHQRIYFFK